MSIKGYLRSIRQFFFPIRYQNVPNSYSQCGEDRILDFLFYQKGVDKITYLDVGAYKPIDSSNTFLFYSRRNGIGVCIEADSELADKFREARPKDTVVNCAIDVDGSETISLYRFDEPSLNTLSQAEAERRDKIGEYKIISIEKIQSFSLEKIINIYFKDRLPLFVSLDIEGIDYDVLLSFNFDLYPIPVFVVETVKYSNSYIKEKDLRIVDLMISRGYFVYADTYINTIFVHRSWYYA